MQQLLVDFMSKAVVAQQMNEFNLSSEDAAILGGAIIGMILVVLAIFYIPFIFYLLSLHKALKRCGDAATFAPGLVWLNLIPIFNIVWLWITVFKVSSSIRGATNDQHSGGFGVGLAMMICNVVSLVISPVGLVFIILLIVHWVTVVGGGRLAEQGSQE